VKRLLVSTLSCSRELAGSWRLCSWPWLARPCLSTPLLQRQMVSAGRSTQLLLCMPCVVRRQLWPLALALARLALRLELLLGIPLALAQRLFLRQQLLGCLLLLLLQVLVLRLLLLRRLLLQGRRRLRCARRPRRRHGLGLLVLLAPPGARWRAVRCGQCAGCWKRRDSRERRWPVLS
jgi:hypothetical protein